MSVRIVLALFLSLLLFRGGAAEDPNPSELLLRGAVSPPPPSTVDGIRTRDLARNAPVPLIVVDREMSTLAAAPEERLRRPATWLEEHPTDFAHQWQELHGLDARQEGNVLTLANPEHADLLSRSVSFPDFGIATLREIHEGVIRRLQNADSDHTYVQGRIPFPSYYYETRRRSVPLHKLLLWDQEIETLEQYALWFLKAFPEYRLVVTITPPSDQSPGGNEEGGDTIRVDCIHVHVAPPSADDFNWDTISEHRTRRHVAMANWDILQGRGAWEVVASLASSEDPAMQPRLVSSLNPLAHHRIGLVRLGERMERSARNSSTVAQAALRLAATYDHPDFLGRLREHLELDHENPFHLLLLARLAAWQADPDTLTLSRQVLAQKDTLEGDWKDFFSDTLRIYELRSGGQ